MSTRCNIIIKDGSRRIYLYHHHDGYPEGVGAELREYMEKNHPRWWCSLYIANGLVKQNGQDCFAKNDVEYEVTSGLHGDIEYCYVINCRAKTLRCFEITWEDDIHQNYQINWKRVFTRDHLRYIPTIEERNARFAAWAKQGC